MKLLYIVGLEHSGTTLTDKLLGSFPNCVGLGEVASFFSPQHMRLYLQRWQGKDDVRRCSCGKDWAQCEFWCELNGLCGEQSDATIIEKYRALLRRVARLYGDDAVVVDSSKSLSTLQILVEAADELGLRKSDIVVVFAIKDVRSFVASMIRKSGAKSSWLAVVRAFNLWFGSNRQMLRLLRASGLSVVVSLYEALCRDPQGELARHLRRLGVGVAEEHDSAELVRSRSHIAMGNKNFSMRNSDRVRYDDRWFYDDTVLWVYLLHWRARAFNRRIAALARRE